MGGGHARGFCRGQLDHAVGRWPGPPPALRQKVLELLPDVRAAMSRKLLSCCSGIRVLRTPAGHPMGFPLEGAYGSLGTQRRETPRGGVAGVRWPAAFGFLSVGLNEFKTQGAVGKA